METPRLGRVRPSSCDPPYGLSMEPKHQGDRLAAMSYHQDMIPTQETCLHGEGPEGLQSINFSEVDIATSPTVSTSASSYPMAAGLASCGTQLSPRLLVGKLNQTTALRAEPILMTMYYDPHTGVATCSVTDAHLSGRKRPDRRHFPIVLSVIYDAHAGQHTTYVMDQEIEARRQLSRLPCSRPPKTALEPVLPRCHEVEPGSSCNWNCPVDCERDPLFWVHGNGVGVPHRCWWNPKKVVMCPKKEVDPRSVLTRGEILAMLLMAGVEPNPGPWARDIARVVLLLLAIAATLHATLWATDSSAYMRLALLAVGIYSTAHMSYLVARLARYVACRAAAIAWHYLKIAVFFFPALGRRAADAALVRCQAATFRQRATAVGVIVLVTAVGLSYTWVEPGMCGRRCRILGCSRRPWYCPVAGARTRGAQCWYDAFWCAYPHTAQMVDNALDTEDDCVAQALRILYCDDTLTTARYAMETGRAVARPVPVVEIPLMIRWAAERCHAPEYAIWYTRPTRNDGYALHARIEGNGADVPRLIMYQVAENVYHAVAYAPLQQQHVHAARHRPGETSNLTFWAVEFGNTNPPAWHLPGRPHVGFMNAAGWAIMDEDAQQAWLEAANEPGSEDGPESREGEDEYDDADGDDDGDGDDDDDVWEPAPVHVWEQPSDIPESERAAFEETAQEAAQRRIAFMERYRNLSAAQRNQPQPVQPPAPPLPAGPAPRWRPPTQHVLAPTGPGPVRLPMPSPNPFARPGGPAPLPPPPPPPPPPPSPPPPPANVPVAVVVVPPTADDAPQYAQPVDDLDAAGMSSAPSAPAVPANVQSYDCLYPCTSTATHFYRMTTRDGVVSYTVATQAGVVTGAVPVTGRIARHYGCLVDIVVGSGEWLCDLDANDCLASPNIMRWVGISDLGDIDPLGTPVPSPLVDWATTYWVTNQSSSPRPGAIEDFQMKVRRQMHEYKFADGRRPAMPNMDQRMPAIVRALVAYGARHHLQQGAAIRENLALTASAPRQRLGQETWYEAHVRSLTPVRVDRLIRCTLCLFLTVVSFALRAGRRPTAYVLSFPPLLCDIPATRTLYQVAANLWRWVTAQDSQDVWLEPCGFGTYVDIWLDWARIVMVVYLLCTAARLTALKPRDRPQRYTVLPSVEPPVPGPDAVGAGEPDAMSTADMRPPPAGLPQRGEPSLRRPRRCPCNREQCARHIRQMCPQCHSPWTGPCQCPRADAMHHWPAAASTNPLKPIEQGEVLGPPTREIVGRTGLRGPGIIGWSVKGYEPQRMQQTSAHMVAAVRNRVLSRKAPARPSATQAYQRFWTNRWNQAWWLGPQRQLTRTPELKWITYFRPDQRKRIMQSLLAHYRGDQSMMDINTTVDAFLKSEKLTVENSEYQSSLGSFRRCPTDPRVIQGLRDSANRASGPFTRTYKAHIQRRFFGKHGMYYCSGRTNSQIAHALAAHCTPDVDIHTIDLSRFDASPDRSVMAVEDAHQRWMGLSSDPAADKAARGLVQPRIVACDGSTYTNEGTIRSGESGTSVKGGKINMQTMLTVLAIHLRRSPQWVVRQPGYAHFVCGDDTVLFTPRSWALTVEQIDTALRTLGFSCTGRTVGPDSIDFLGSWLEECTGPTGEREWQLVPMAGRQLPKLTCSLSDKAQVHLASGTVSTYAAARALHCSQVLQGLAPSTRNHPLWKPLHARFGPASHTIRPDAQLANTAIPDMRYTPTQEARILARYGLTVASYSDYCASLTASPLGESWDCYALTTVVERDQF